MNKYKLQYWIYAILNKKFGSEVKLHRDSLHLTYEVNRHSFEVSTNTTRISNVKDWLFNKLKESNFEYKIDGGLKFFSKNFENKEFVISFHEQNCGLDYANSNKPVLILSIYSYQKSSK